MAYVVPIHRPSSVRHALRLRFLSAEEECLVVAKANRLEIYTQSADGLSLQHSKAIYGKVTMLEKLHPASSPTDHLFVGTDRYTYFVVSWDAKSRQLRTERSYVDLADKTARDSQTGDRCLIDPTQRFMTLELYEGSVTIIPIIQAAQKKSKKGPTGEIGSLGDPSLGRIEELFVRSSTFLRGQNDKNKPRMALLYEDNQRKVRLKIRELTYTAGGSGDIGTAELDDLDIMRDELELGASHLMPVPAPHGGVLILGETSITYLDVNTNEVVSQKLQDPTVFVAWEQIDSQRWLLGDDYGRLFLLMLVLDGQNQVQSWKLDNIGATSRASALVYLDGGYVYVGSHQGESQVIKISDGSIDIVQTFSNIAPILDFTIMDLGSRAGDGQIHEFSSGQARIVTGSGAWNDGSLRSVRSGVGLEELGVLGEMQHITDLWALRSSGSSEFSDILLVSFVEETRIFQFSPDGEVEEVDNFKGLSLPESTLLVSNLPNDKLVQVTESAVLLADLDSGMVISRWVPAKRRPITAVTANDDHLVLSVGGQTLIVLAISNDLKLVSMKDFSSDSQIAGVTIPTSPAKVCIAGFWQNAEVSVFGLDNLEIQHSQSLGQSGDAVPRSVLLAQILPEHSPTLFVAMADGNVITFSFDIHTSMLSEMQKVVLGSEQPSFKILPRGNGLFNVFATCEQPSLIYASEGRIIYSAVNSDKASRVCHFNSEVYPGSIAVATSEDLKIALVDTERTTQLQTLSVGETVRRIAYSAKEKTFGLGTIKRTIADGVETVKSHFKLADEVMFRELDTVELNDDELVESVIRAEFPDGVDDTLKEVTRDRFIVGTSYLDDTQDESQRGRILLYEVKRDRKLKKVTELAVKGACRALGMVNGRIVAALIKTIVIYEVAVGAFGQTSFVKVATYRTSTAPIDISVTDNLIAVADLMKSVSIVKYERGENGLPDTLTEVARHFQTSWSTAVVHVDDDTFLQSDAEGNLTVLRQNVNGVTADDRRRLEMTGEVQLGEMVNRMRWVNVPLTPGAVVIPRAFIGTVEGSIYLFALIAPDRQDLLMRLQVAIASYVQSPGHMPFAKYRAFKTSVREAEEPFRFVDGELIERFLDCPLGLQDEIVEGLGVSAEEVRGMVEGLKRLH